MHIHILGICGTFMGGLACLAKEKGFTVSGSDQNVYPPMSTQLSGMGIHLHSGYDPAHLNGADLVVIGNAMSRGNPLVEHVLNEQIPYISGPQWLADYILKDRWVIAVAGTHGKTTTSSIVAWILDYAKLNPGFLIGGVPANFGRSARLGDAPFFVVEADEYDTAFFDKRSKFVHYHPRTCILNNLEFDHADIFENLAAIQQQFHHLVRTVPGNGQMIVPGDCQALNQVMAKGCWTPIESLGPGGKWTIEAKKDDWSAFEVFVQGKSVGNVCWGLIGEHNAYNALAAMIAARHVGVPIDCSIEALAEFKSVKRRLEVRGEVNGVTVYDDFAHHPTAIETTLKGLRAKVQSKRILAVLDVRSNTMCLGTHQHQLKAALQAADRVLIYRSDKVTWDIESIFSGASNRQVFNDTQAIIDELITEAKPGDHILIMSNGGFDGIHQRLLDDLTEQVTIA